MALNEISASVEGVIRDAIQNVNQSVWDEYKIRVESIDFKWSDVQIVYGRESAQITIDVRATYE